MDKTNEKYLQAFKNQIVLYQRILVVCVLLYTPFFGLAQLQDSVVIKQDSSYAVDSIGKDSIGFSIQNHKSSMETQVEYQADDSIVLDMQSKKARLYGNAIVVYEDITLKSYFIEVDFDKKDVLAKGRIDDSTGKYVSRPEFEDAGKVYEADTMKYNFDTKKGISYGVLTTEKDGYIHGKKVLRDSNENIYVKDAQFTTCNLPDPHFYIRADKIKVIPKKQIITGPANLVIEDISTPLFVPFGFFPIPEKRKHGILFPNFGESPERGFFIRGLGYYIPINDYLDLQLKTDVYFRGSWGVSANSNYYRRYKYRGNFGLSYNRNELGEPESHSFSVSNDYRLNWTYNRDAKAKPGSSFSANVNFVTSSFLKNNTSNYEDIIATNSTSSINYGKSLFNNKLNIGLNSNIYQDLSNGDLNLTLPQLTANVSRQMLFSKFKSNNKTLKSFVNNFGFSYAGTFRNEVKTKDTTLITGVGELFGRIDPINPSNLLEDFKSGVSHSIPLSTSFKALKWVTVSPNFSFSEYWYFNTTEKTWDDINDTLLINNNVQGFERAYRYQGSVGLSTIIYGTKIFKKGNLKAIRHVVRPNASIAWSPDFTTGEEYGYRSVQTDSSGTMSTYSIYENGLLRVPSNGAQGAINFGFGNNLEIKIRTKDTADGGIKKVKIIESLNVGSGYNFLADSINLANFSINGNTTILNKIRINFRTSFDPYAYDSIGSSIYKSKEFLWNTNQKLGQFIGTGLSISTNLNPQAFKKKDSDKVNDAELEYINSNIQNYVDFSLPWSLNINYNFTSPNSPLKTNTISQNFGFVADLKLTENWKIGVSSGYDLTRKELAFTSLEFFRNLHCWEMNFKWYPIQRQMFEFTIRVKSSTLQDLKLNRRRSWWDS